MCSHYEAPAPQLVAETFGIDPFEQVKLDLWPGYIGAFIRRAESVDHDALTPAAVEGVPGAFGLIPF